MPQERRPHVRAHGETIMRVRKGGVYRFNPVSFDRFYPCHNIAVGEHVRVGKVPGLPRAATVNAGHNRRGKV